jgi:hypothetical protein
MQEEGIFVINENGSKVVLSASCASLLLLVVSNPQERAKEGKKLEETLALCLHTRERAAERVENIEIVIEPRNS